MQCFAVSFHHTFHSTASSNLKPAALGHIALDACGLSAIGPAGLSRLLHLAAPRLALLVKAHLVLDTRVLDVLPPAQQMGVFNEERPFVRSAYCMRLHGA